MATLSDKIVDMGGSTSAPIDSSGNNSEAEGTGSTHSSDEAGSINAEIGSARTRGDVSSEDSTGSEGHYNHCDNTDIQQIEELVETNDLNNQVKDIESEAVNDNEDENNDSVEFELSEEVSGILVGGPSDDLLSISIQSDCDEENNEKFQEKEDKINNSIEENVKTIEVETLEAELVIPETSPQPRKRKGETNYEEDLPCKRPNNTDTSTCNNSITSTSMPSCDKRKVRRERAVIPSKDNPPPEMDEWLKTFQCWSHAERLMALNELMDTCEPTQVRHVMQVIEPQFQRDFISLLPKELALYVLTFLEPRDLFRAAQTCSYWRILADDSLLWREKCRETGIFGNSCFVNKRRFQYNRISQSPPFPEFIDKGGTHPWKAAFRRQMTIEGNWRSKPLKPPRMLKGHDDHVITCLQFCGTRIVSGSDDNTLKVWSAITGKCLRTLVGHTGGVWSSQMCGNTIVSGSTDRTLKVWNADSGNCEHTLYGHTSTVRCMHLHEKQVVSGSRDATLRVWNIESGQCNHVLVGHVAAVRCVQYDGRFVVSGAYDYMVKVWDPVREECLHTLQGHTNRVYSLQFDGIHVVSGSLDTSIRVWDVESGTCKHTLMGHQSLTSGMELRENILVSGNADSTVKVWDINTGQCLQTLSGTNKHQSAVTCLQFNSKFVVTSSDDGTVKLWDVQTGEFIRNLVALDSGGSGGVVWRIRATETKLVCAVGSRNGTEETKLLVLDFDADEQQ